MLFMNFSVSLLLAFCVINSASATATTEDDHGSESVSYDADSFKSGVDAKKHFVMFFAPWCGHCKNLAPTWDELAKVYKEDDSPVTIAKVDCTEQTALCAEHEITGFPTLKFFDKGGKSVRRYSSRRDLESLKNFVQEQVTGGAEKTDAEDAAEGSKDNSLIVLNDDNFEASVAAGGFFIKFYAPWCGHCKRLAPTWDELAEALADNEKASIAKIDCTQSSVICKKYEVRGYPTLLWFMDGEKIGKYQGSRSLDALKEYVLSQLEAADQTDDGEGDEASQGDAAEEDGDSDGEVKDLNAANFKSFLSNRLVFVKFFAPWCGHCKRLAPTWDDLADNLKGEPVSIAKVDCTQHKSVCDDFQVRGYPTLKLFRNGEFVQDYKGGRTLEDLQKFASGHVTQRDEL